ncbi:VWA domain-containing protein (plasmid) [Xanthomonas citri pv. citri]|uniref:vWA domain-containing protein n=1 Tax=Xanthomonas citri TaxID=346 RepID=UPI001931C94D|nr:vWA domain-containing protein [Xanthomonas citri]QRD62755.1 VWA domain-containing protein [Xanthomonas citri pv. citri]QRD67082.1 VWA domain-containing protein [Xanthomonas citri pv. citri]QRD71665.1 VWA domain-containing protein [Xanthomonas citri pv. citri]
MNHDTCRTVLRTALLGGALDPTDAIRSARAELGGMPLALNALASIMGCKIKVRYGASELAHTDGKSIDLMNLPIPSSKADVDTFVLMLSLAYGLGHHELGHVAESDFSVLRGLERMLKTKAATPLEESLFRIIEDVRMENAHIRNWPNSRKYLDSLTQSLLLTGFYTHVGADAPPMSALTGYLLYRLYHDYRGDAGTRELAIEAREVCVKLLSQPVVTRLDALLPQMDHLADTADSLTMARNLARFIEQEKEQQEREQQSTPTPSPEQQGDGQVDGQADDDSQGNPDDTNATSPEGGPAADAPGQPSQGSTERGAGGGGDQSVLQALRSLVDPDNVDPRVGERADAIRQALGGVVADIAPQSVGTIDMQNPGVTASIDAAVDQPSTAPNADCNMDDALAVTSQVRKSFKRHMQAVAEVQTSLHRRGRNLSASHLHRVAGGDNRVFKSVSQEIEMDTAVVLAIDKSGSTDGQPIKLISEAVFATAVALEGIEGVSCGALTFPGNQVLLPFGRKAKTSPDAFCLHGSGRTPMDHALYLGTRMLMTQRKSRRVMLLATDGRPDSVEQTSLAAEYVVQQGIELYVIGIGDAENVCDFPNWLYLEQIEDLPTVVTNLFTRKLSRAA